MTELLIEKLQKKIKAELFTLKGGESKLKMRELLPLPFVRQKNFLQSAVMETEA